MSRHKSNPLTVQAKDTYDPGDYITVHLDYFNGMRAAIRHAHGDKCICIYCRRDEQPRMETSPAPVEGVVPGSNLERQIQLARQTIERWPDDVRRAMGIVAQETRAATETSECRCGQRTCSQCGEDPANYGNPYGAMR